MLDEYLYVWIVLLAIAATVIHTAVRGRRARREAMRRFEEDYGKAPDKRQPVKKYQRDFHNFSGEEQPDPSAVDAITWNDLNMDAVYRRINSCVSSIGEEVLYHQLHMLTADEAVLRQRERLIHWMQNDAANRKRLQSILLGIGKREYSFLSYYLFHAADKKLGQTRRYLLRGLLPLAGILLMPVHLYAGALVFIVSAGANILLFSATRNRLETEMETMQHLSALLQAAEKIDREFSDRLTDVGLSLKEPLQTFRRGRSLIPASAHAVTAELEALTAIPRAVFLWDVIRYNRTIDRLIRFRAEVRQIFIRTGTLDAAISAASFRDSLPVWCRPSFLTEHRVFFSAMIHPLLEEPVANSGELANDTIITGSNASGKSTFIKTVAVNHILAQTLNTCTAKQYQLCPSYVCSSMALKDDLLAGESYFIAEIKSLRRILDYTRERRCICLIDEILRGTNTPERIAASTAVLKALHETDSLCLIASHDIELTEILKNEYDAYHFRESFTDGQISFDYKLKDGPSTTTNAIKLLEYMGFSNEIVEEATRRVKHHAGNPQATAGAQQKGEV